MTHPDPDAAPTAVPVHPATPAVPAAVPVHPIHPAKPVTPATPAAVPVPAAAPAAVPGLDLAALHDGLRRGGARAALSHEVAAQVLGIELLEPGQRRLTVPRNRSRLRLPDWKVVRSDVAQEDLVAEEGLRVTSAARTVADLARVLPPPEALVAADSALRLGLATPEALVRRLVTVEGSGAARVRAVGTLIDPASGSVLETLLRWTLHDAGVPAPRSQHRIWGEDGHEVARVDFCWPEQRLVVEADGYAFHSDRAAYRRDRERGNTLVRLGWRVLRVTWEDVRQRPSYVVALVQGCLADVSTAHELLRAAA